MDERALDLGASATLFAGSDLDREIARMPAIDRPFQYFELADDAVRIACEWLGARQDGAFLVQGCRRFGMDDMRAIRAAAIRRGASSAAASRPAA